MKKILTFLFFVLVCVNFLSSQTEKGTWLLSGNAAYVRSDKSGTLNMSPSVGYFVLNHLAGGAQLNFLSVKSGSYFSLGPFARYYFYGDDRGRFYANVGLNIGGGSGSKFDTGYSFGAGYALFLNESIAVDLGMQYNKVGSASGIFAIGAGFQIHFMRLRE